MTNPIRIRSAARPALAAALLALVATAASAQGVRARNLVYTQSNDPAGNAILAYTRAVDGSLTPLAGGPFPTGGLGITPTFALGPFDSDQEVILNPEKTLLFTVNGGSDSVSVFKIHPDGSLGLVPGAPFPSGGSNPVSVGLLENILCVVNQDADPGHPGQSPPNYATFHVGENGALSAMPRSVFPLDLGSSPSQALPADDARLFFGADFFGGLLRSFRVGPGGVFEAWSAQPLPASVFAGTGAPAFPLGLATHPRKNLLYVGFVTINRLGVYEFNERGALNFLGTAANSGKALCWLTTNRAGTRLYTSNPGDTSISVYDIQRDPTNPVEIQHLVYPSTGGGFQLGLDSTERFLQLVTQQSAPTSNATANAIHVFSVDANGTLTEVPSSPTILPVRAGVRPQGMAAL